MADVTIRAAEADDDEFLAWLILTAGRAHVGRGIWEVILGLPEEQCLHFLRLLSTTIVHHLFHYSCYLVAEVNGVPKAGLGGYDPSISGNGALFLALPEVFRRVGGRPPNAPEANTPPRILNCIPEPVEGAWMIDSVAAVPDSRRQGIVSRLLETVLQQGRDKGFRHAQVNIYIGNTAAQRLYERQGFAIMDEIIDPYFEAEIGSRGMARMLRAL
jgi:ribosomal protein S18 acetylase RimI-like enzyme